MKSFIPNRTIEYNDNRISKFIAQYGKCAISGVELGLNDWHCHHKNPYHLSKDDSFSNLVILHEPVHRLVHMKDYDKDQSINANLKSFQKANRETKRTSITMS